MATPLSSPPFLRGSAGARYPSVTTCVKLEEMLTSVSPCMVLTALPPPTSAGQRDQPLDWQTAPPVHVLSFMVLGSEKDAKSREVGVVCSWWVWPPLPGAID